MATLGEYLGRQTPLSLRDAVAMIRSIAVQVAQYHQIGRAHGDISENSVTVDDMLQPWLSGCVGFDANDMTGDSKEHTGHAAGTAVQQRQISTYGKRQRVPATLIAHLRDVMTPDDSASEVPSQEPAEGSSPEIGAVESAIDPRVHDVHCLAELLCRMLTGTSADAYLRSPRVKGQVAASLQPLLDGVFRDRVSTPGHDPLILDATGFVDALDRAVALDESDPRTAETQDGQLEVVEATPSCVTGVNLGDPAPAHSREAHSRAANTREAGGGPKSSGPIQPDASLPFQKLGHYHILARLGQGGMGEVYLGYESGLDRRVAIKVLPARFATDPDLVRRFHSEAVAAAKLVHPNIIQIYYIGEDQGHAFFAMQHVEGMSLAQLLAKGRRLNLDESLAICEEVTAGLVAAHKLDLVHRDIKPSNILLDRVHRRALLADFGLVKSLQDAERSHTSTGMVLGTADYIAPEQGLGNAVDHRCDLYSLGVVMYQLFAGRLPFLARESTAVIFQHVYVAAPALSDLAPHVPQPVAAIVEKLLAKSPDERYQSAGDLLRDLRAFRATPGAAAHGNTTGWPVTEPSAFDGEADFSSPSQVFDTSSMASQATTRRAPLPPPGPIAGPTAGSLDRPDQGRRRVVLALAAAAGMPALAGAFWFATRDRQPDKGNSLAQLGNGQLGNGQLGNGQLGNGQLGNGQSGDGQSGSAQTASDQSRTGQSGTGHLGTGQSRIGARAPVEVRRFPGHASEVNCFALTPDEALLIVADRASKLTVWDFKMAEQRKSFRAHSGPVRRLIITADGKHAVTASADQTLKLWELANWKQVTQFNGHTDAVTSIVNVPGRNEIISSSFDGRLRRWSLDKGAPLAWYGTRPLNENESAEWSASAEPESDQQNLALQNLERHVAWVRDLVILPRGDQVISAGNDRAILVWDVDTAQVVDRLLEHKGPVMCLALSRDGSRLLSGGYDKTLCLWDMGTRQLIRHLPHDSATPASVSISPDGLQAASGAADGQIHVWDLNSGAELHVFAGHEGIVTSLAYLADGRHIVSGGEDNCVRVWL